MNRINLPWTEALAALLLAVVAGLLLLPGLPRLAGARADASCQYNLKQMGVVFKMYVNESRGGLYPPRSPWPDNWIVDASYLYPQYLSDLNHLACPASPMAHDAVFALRRNWSYPGASVGESHPDCVSSHFYNYTGYMLNGDEMALAFYLAWQETGGALTRDLRELPLPKWSASDWLPPGKGVPVMWDRVTPDPAALAHQPAGINVLHMDGSVDFVRYSPLNTSSNFPATLLSAELFGAASPRLPADCR